MALLSTEVIRRSVICCLICATFQSWASGELVRIDWDCGTIFRNYKPDQHPELAQNFRSKSFPTESHAIVWLIENFPDHRLTDSEWAILKSYQHGSPVNLHLRGEYSPSGSDLSTTVKALDEIVAKSRIKEEVYVYRYVQKNQLDPQSLVEGQEYSDPAFLSTSLSSPENTINPNYILLRLKLPPGTHATNVQKNTDRETGLGGTETDELRWEMELLLARNQKFKIGKQKVTDRGIVIVNMEALP